MEADGPRGWFARLILITLCVHTLIAAVRPMVSYRAVGLGADAFQLGLIGAGFAALSFVLAVPMGRWTDRWGTYPVLVAGVSLNTASTAALLWIDSVPGLVASQCVLGVGQLCVAVASQTLIGNAPSRLSRDARFGAFTIAVSSAQLVAPFGAGLIAGTEFAHELLGGDDPYGAGGVFLVATGFGLIAMIIAISLGGRRGKKPPPAPSSASPREKIPLSRVLRIPGMPQALVASALVFTSIDIITVYLPAYGVQIGLSVEAVALLLSLRALGSIVGRILLIPLVARVGRRPVLIGSVLLPAACLVVLPLLPTMPALALLCTLAGVGLGVGQPVTLAWAVEQTPMPVRGTAVGLRIAGMRLSQTALPPIVGVFAGIAGVGIVFPAISLTLLVVGVVVATARFPNASEESPIRIPPRAEPG